MFLLQLRFRFRLSALLTVLIALSASRLALADAATAEVLFQQGKALMDEGDFAAACPKLAESFRLDPATGALLALAICHEKEGRLASAWTEFVDAASRSKREGRLDRAEAAQNSADKLKPRLSRITVEVGAAFEKVAGLEIRRDGEVIGKAVWGVAVPVDGGEHTIEATLPDHQPWSTTISIAAEAAHETIEVPELLPRGPADGATSAPAKKPLAEEELPGERPEPERITAMTPLRIAGIVTAGVGLIGAGIGTYYGLDAMSGAGETDDECPENRCVTLPATTTRSDARESGSISTIAFALGGALVATGVALYFIGEPKEETGPTTALSLQPTLSQSSLGFALDGPF